MPSLDQWNRTCSWKQTSPFSKVKEKWKYKNDSIYVPASCSYSYLWINEYLPILVWPQWWSFAGVSQQGVDFSKTRLKCKSSARVKIVLKKDWIVKLDLNVSPVLA